MHKKPLRRALDTDDDFRMDEPAEKEKRKMWHFGEEANIDSLSSWPRMKRTGDNTKVYGSIISLL